MPSETFIKTPPPVATPACFNTWLLIAMVGGIATGIFSSAALGLWFTTPATLLAFSALLMAVSALIITAVAAAVCTAIYANTAAHAKKKDWQ